jgi:isopenicillin-N N-acyltransferase-like protein
MSPHSLTFLSLSVVFALFLVQASDAAFCNGKPKPDAKPNLNPIFTADPVFVREVKNAKLYVVGDGDDKISVVHLWGSPYERGFAHGTIMKQDVLNMIDSVWEYIVEQVESAINGTLKKFPPKVVDFLATEGLDGASLHPAYIPQLS